MLRRLREKPNRGKFDIGGRSIRVPSRFDSKGGSFEVASRLKRYDSLAEVLRSQQEEITKYKWIESEKAGQDIGWERAAREWLAQHFPGWKRDRWERAVKEAVQLQSLNAESHRLN
jgi:hypothetical protein